MGLTHIQAVLFFSRSITFFSGSDARIITTELISVIRVENNKMIIAFSRFILNLLVGSQIYFYTKKATSSVDRDVVE